MKHNQSLFCKTCLGKGAGAEAGAQEKRAPVWFMRQAGRYLPEYRKIRSKYQFTEMYKIPEVVTEITMQPVKRFDIDAAIIFSDILTIPEAMGIPLEFQEQKGPILGKIPFDSNTLQKCQSQFHIENLQYVFDAISLTKKELSKDKALIGFAGSPWTVACYIIEGGTSKNFSTIKVLCHENKSFMLKLLEILTDITIEYCARQIESGADAIQIFDTWGGILDMDSYKEFNFIFLQKIFQSLAKYNVPLIYFTKWTNVSLQFANSMGCSAIGLDWTIPLQNARKVINKSISLQGNLDPNILLCNHQVVQKKVKQMIQNSGLKNKYIVNLGHGVLPNTPIASVQAFVETAKEESAKIYASIEKTKDM